MDSSMLVEEEESSTEFPSILKLLIKKTRISGNNPQIRQWCYEVMSTRPHSLPKNEEKCREEILDRIEEGWQREEWVINMPQIADEILDQNLLTKRTPPATRTSHEADGLIDDSFNYL